MMRSDMLSMRIFSENSYNVNGNEVRKSENERKFSIENITMFRTEK